MRDAGAGGGIRGAGVGVVEVSMAQDGRRKWITVGRLRELLADGRLDPRDQVAANIVGNLAIYREGEQVGVMYIGLDELSLFSDPDRLQGRAA